MARHYLGTEELEAELRRMREEQGKAIDELHSISKVGSNDLNMESENDDDDVEIIKDATQEEKEALIRTMNKEMKSLKVEIEKRKDSERKLYEAYEGQKRRLEQSTALVENLRLELASLKGKSMESDEIQKLREEVKMLEGELQAQRNRTASEEVIALRNELRLAMEAEENSKQAMDEFALVIKEVAAEANEAKEQIEILKKENERLKHGIGSKEGSGCNVGFYDDLDEARKENDNLKNTIDWLKIEAEEALLTWSGKETEYIKRIKKEEDEKAGLQGENRKLVQALEELEQRSKKLREDTENLREVLEQALSEANERKQVAEMMKAENSRLKVFLAEKERTLASYEKKKDNELDDLEFEEDESDRERKKAIASSSSENEPKTMTTSLSKKEIKPPSAIDEKKQRRLIPSYSRKEHDDEHKKIKKDASMDKELRVNSHGRSSGTFWFDPKAVLPIPSLLPIPGLSSRHKELRPSRSVDDLSFSIPDLSDSQPTSPPLPGRNHRRMSSSFVMDADKLTSSDEFEHEESSLQDDMEVERAGQHSTKKKVLLRRFGVLWRRKDHGHSPNPTHQNQQLNKKEIAT